MMAVASQMMLSHFRLFFLVLIFFMPLSHSQSYTPQNLETFYPFPIPSPSPSPSPTQPPNGTVSPPLVHPSPEQVLGEKSSNSGRVAKAIAATLASTFVAATLLFFLIQRYLIARRKKKQVGAAETAGHRPNSFSAAAGTQDRLAQAGSNSKGQIIDENGLDVVYWRKLEAGGKGRFQNEPSPSPKQEEEEEVVNTRNSRRKMSEPLQEVPLLRGKSSTSHVRVEQEIQEHERSFTSASSDGSGFSFHVLEKPSLPSQPSNPPPPPPIIKPPPSLPQTPPPEPTVVMAVAKTQGPAAPPPPPAPAIPAKKSPSPGPPPPPPPTPLKKISPGPPPPPLPKAGGLAASSNIPAASKGKQLDATEFGESWRAEGKASGNNGQVKLKPLHWDKVNRNTDHSMVWDKLEGGSFRFDDDLMEALFGYVATNRKSPKRESGSSTPVSSPPTPIVILDPRKSQNTAIVIKSLAISRKEVLDALTDGYGLDVETLEKLIRIAPTKEEESQILEFRGDPTKLADAESFLYHLLKAVPSAFSGFNAMLFRSSYDTEICQFKEYLETLELGCKELRNRGLFTKLLEAILKAGNRMNAGTSRGNAQAFKLSSLKKLSDVKSTDGRTTLLHFVVEEVVRSEGKKLVLNRNRSFSRSSSRSSGSGTISESSASLEERHREYTMLGLPVVGGLSSEFSNVKKAAQIDYDTFAGTCSALTARVREIKLLVSKSAITGDGGGGFVKEMKGFLEAAEEELVGLSEEQKRVMDIVKRTTDYYQAGASNDPGAHQLQLFVIIKDFLGMVDQACVEIARSLQQKKTRGSSSPGSSPKSPASKMPVRFPNLTSHFLGERSRSNSSESDTEF